MSDKEMCIRDRMHSHIPTVLSAVLTGEPYQPKVWIERSGNKLSLIHI